MNVNSGYKRTEVGVIPEDWGVVNMFDACSKIQDGTHFSPRIGGSDYLYVTSKNIRFGQLDITTASWIDAAQHQAIYQRCDVKKGDLLLTKDGANTGNAALNTLEEEFSLLSSVAFLRFNSRKHCAAYFLQQILTSHGQRQIQDAMSGNAITRLTLEKINKLRFPTPPTKAEQESIAAALRDVDALLDGLSRLISKKRNLKNAAMQQLLTGQTRIAGFDGEWETKRVGRIGTTYGGLTGKTKADFGVGHSRYVTFLNVLENVVIDPHQCEPVRVDPGERQNPVRRGDILFNGTSETPDDLAMGAVTRQDEDNLFLNSFSFGFRVHDPSEHLPLFLAYYFRGSPGRHIMHALAQGATRYNMSKGQFLALDLSLPQRDEQKAISTVLYDMDAEITALEARREKTRDLKQAMMYELLTGKTRLVQPEVAHA